MLRTKAALLAAIILVAIIVAYHWRNGAGNGGCAGGANRVLCRLALATR